MGKHYSILSKEDLGVRVGAVTDPFLSEAEDFAFTTKWYQNRWTNLHIIILYTLLTILSILLASLWLKGPTHRDLGTLFSTATLRESRNSCHILINNTSSCEGCRRILSTQVHMELLGERRVYGFSYR